MRKSLQEKDALLQRLRTFLNDDQIDALGGKKIAKWSEETVIKSLKFRFSLSVHGYQILRSTNYPLPGYSTLTERIRDFSLQYGIFDDVTNTLPHKVAAMEPADRFCFLSIDEMRIRGSEKDYDKNKHIFYGKVTLGCDCSVDASHVLVVLIRGIKGTWKQIIGAHCTAHATNEVNMKNFITTCIKRAEACGLYVVGLGSDMGSSNRNLWKGFLVGVKKNGIRKNSFRVNGHKIYCFPDVCHLLKNLKSAILKQDLILPEAYVQQHHLPSNRVSFDPIKSLWNAEIDSKKDLRSLYHLHANDLEPDGFEKMNVGAAVRFFSVTTAAAIEHAVSQKILNEWTLATAHFIRLIDTWFKLVTSRLRKTSITRRNKNAKFELFEQMIHLFQHIRIGGRWAPLNTGMILSNLSFIDVSTFLLQQDGIFFILLHRFTQDATENIFSQVRRRAGMTPCSKEVLSALKLITLSQFMSDIKSVDYLDENDTFLLNYIAEKKQARVQGRNNNVLPINGFPSVPADLSEKFQTVLSENAFLNSYDRNLLFNVGGSTTAAIMKKVCLLCIEFLSRKSSDISITNKMYKNFLNFGGLKEPCPSLLVLLMNCELLYRKFRYNLLHKAGFCTHLIEKINCEIDVPFPLCCKMKSKIVDHFFTVRSFAALSLECERKPREKMYGTACPKRRKA